MDDEQARKRKVIPQGYFDRKNQPKKRRAGGGGQGNKFLGAFGEDDEEEEKMEKEYMLQMVERPSSGKILRRKW